ncbi:hypothetical protein KUCAC02_019422 [Chaenocephalus aceratus]|uniref:Uncharacterized protein n=1 Tax=Chaenocephalus aceratus TaxID=36190 RepID=A0ACB9VNG9_CHAAC|nr:hypothetical protein KUCAC02_019422 [Chaenocephalus aceratus]
MDPRIVKQILDLKVHHQYPEGSTKKEQYVMKRRADTFTIKDGELYYICRHKKNQTEHLAKVVSTAEEANDLFAEFHCSNIGGQCGVEKTHCAIIARYYWPGMEGDIREWIAQCPQCQAKRANIKEKQEYSPIEVTEPLELVGMDLVGKLTGSEFCNKVNSGLCETLAIKRSLCSAYHPQTNGLVEKLNGTIQRSLNKMVAGHPKRWDQVLQSTNEYLVKEEKVSRLVATEEIHEGLNKQEAVFTEVKKNMKRSQDNVRKRKVKKGQEDNFQVGDQVLRRNVRQEQRKGGKLDDDWLGPYTILELEGKKAVLAKGTTKLQTNIDHLTHYIQPEERIPAKLQKLSDLSPLAGPQHTKTQTQTPTTQTPTAQTPTAQTPTAQTPTTQTPTAQHPPHEHPPHSKARPKWHQRILNFVRKWLEGEIVNSYITMVGRKAGALTLDSYLMTSLWEGTHKGYLRSLDLLKYDVAVGAVCSHGHWTLIIMYLKERRSLFVDPFGATDAQIQKCKNSIGPQKVSENREMGMRNRCSPQTTGLIGMRGVCMQEQILSGQNIDYPVDQKGVAMLRLDMSMSLVTNSDDLSQLCRACGELSSLAEGDIDTWIECTTCNMWYHIGCVGLSSPTEDEYFCPSCKS